MLGTKKENGRMVEEVKKEEVEASGDALIIADGLYAVADAIREMTRVLKEANSEPEGSNFLYDLMGNTAHE